MTVTTRDGSLKQRIVGLDELRGIAILVVMLAHGRSLLPLDTNIIKGFGHYGVVLFFFISGFIIAKILLNEKERYLAKQITRYDYFSKFYIRRIFRILPLYYLSLLVSAIIYPEYAGSFPYSLTFLQNYYWANTDQIMGRTDVSWSLAVEEHMYIFLPMLVYFLNRKAALIVLSIVIILGYFFFVYPVGPFDHHKYFVTHNNMQYIAMGTLLAFGRGGNRLLLIFMASWLFISYSLSNLGVIKGNYAFNRQLIDMLLLVLVVAVVSGKLNWIRYFSILKYIGLRCFGLYIVHFFVKVWAQDWLDKSYASFAFYFFVSIILAELSFRYFEEPIQNSRVWYEQNRVAANELYKFLGIFLSANVVYILLS